MKEELLRHEQRGKYAYILENGNARIMLEVGKNDVAEAYINYYDKYGLHHIPGFNLEKKKMEKISSGRFSDFYVVEVKPLRRRLQYYFTIHFKSGEVMNYDAYGLTPDEGRINEFDPFSIPYINLEDSISVPSWSKDSIVYQIFPDSFNNPNGLLLDGSKNSNGSLIMGGTLKGIEEKIPHFLDLGVNTIYLTPIFKANTNHRYETVDYMEIDPLLGSKDDFKDLVKALHKNNIKIILDGVFNHTSSRFFAFQDILKNQQKSIYKDWYYIKGYPVDNNPKKYKNLNYDTFSFFWDMPKLNTMNPDAKNYIFNVCKYWTEEFDIDGWRLDVANEVPLTFWKEFRTFMKSINKDLLLIGESWNDSSIYLQGDTFDTVMNYLFREYTFDLFKGDNELNYRINKFIDMYGEMVVKYPYPCFNALFNLISSHDVNRLYNDLKDERIIRAIVAMQMTMSGIPFIYYGDEMGLKNDKVYENRGAIDWDNYNKIRYDYYKRLISIRKSNKALRDGLIKFNKSNEGVLEYIKYNDDNQLRILINLSNVEYIPKINGEILFKTNKENKLDLYDILIIRIK